MADTEEQIPEASTPSQTDVVNQPDTISPESAVDTDAQITEISTPSQTDVMNQPDTISLEQAAAQEPSSDDK